MGIGDCIAKRRIAFVNLAGMFGKVVATIEGREVQSALRVVSATIMAKDSENMKHLG
jgi:hypothetical protein